jgi:hypothetical protein
MLTCSFESGHRFWYDQGVPVASNLIAKKFSFWETTIFSHLDLPLLKSPKSNELINWNFNRENLRFSTFN